MYEVIQIMHVDLSCISEVLIQIMHVDLLRISEAIQTRLNYNRSWLDLNSRAIVAKYFTQNT